MRGWEVMTALEAAIKCHVEEQSEEDSSSSEKTEEDEKLLTKRKKRIGKAKDSQLDEETKSSKENKDKHNTKKQKKYPGVICLYGKHMKRKEQQRLLGGGTIYPAGVGTPGRLLSLLETSPPTSAVPNRTSGIIDISRTHTLIIDMYHDSKSFCLFTLHDTSNGFLLFPSLFSFYLY